MKNLYAIVELSERSGVNGLSWNIDEKTCSPFVTTNKSKASSRMAYLNKYKAGKKYSIVTIDLMKGTALVDILTLL